VSFDDKTALIILQALSQGWNWQTDGYLTPTGKIRDQSAIQVLGLSCRYSFPL